jgi:hypothetical protein
MTLMLNDDPISKEDWTEIYELLDSKALDRPIEARMNKQLKFRALGMALLHFIFEKRLFLMDSKKWDLLSKEDCLKRCK